MRKIEFFQWGRWNEGWLSGGETEDENGKLIGIYMFSRFGSSAWVRPEFVRFVTPV